jgi:predicted component of type VI protein secretion system
MVVFCQPHVHLALFVISAYSGTKHSFLPKGSPMNVRLILNRNRKCVWSAELSHTEATLGRARGCTVRIPSSEVSRQHCRLRMESGVLTVEDLESVNGTFINGERVRDIETVHSGDRLTLGPITFRVEYDTATEDMPIVDGEVDFPVVEAVDEVEAVEAVEEVPTKPDRSTIPMVEPTEELDQVAEPIAAMDDTGQEVSILDDPDSEIHLPDSGDDFRDFLIELDDSSERPDLS